MSLKPKSKHPLYRKHFGKGKAQAALLQVGMTDVEEWGMLELSLRDLQRRARTSSSTAFKGFENKVGFVCQLADASAHLLVENLARAVQDPEGRLHSAVAGWVNTLRQRPTLGALAFAKPVIHGFYNPPGKNADLLGFAAGMIYILLQREDPEAAPDILHQRHFRLVTMLLGYGLLVAHGSPVANAVPDPVGAILGGTRRPR